MNKAIFLDRDGIINDDKRGYVYKIKDLRIIPGAINGLKILQDTGYKLIIITNQSGIASGYYTKKDYFNLRKELCKILKEHNIIIDAEYFCPHHPDDDCGCRKPQIGMLEKAAKDFHLNLNQCWMIGDKPSDILAGKNAGCKTIHVLTGEEKNPITYADFVAKDLIEAANDILIIITNKNSFC